LPPLFPPNCRGKRGAAGPGSKMNLAQPSKNQVSILIVDDDETARYLTCLLISTKIPGASIYQAADGLAGEKLFRMHTPEIVITDIRMPKANGIEMARKIMGLKNDTKIIVLTAYEEKGVLEQFQEIGNHSYLQKPLDFNELITTIRNFIEEIADLSGVLCTE
jgi:YesN/AraC family two-component response regulator